MLTVSNVIAKLEESADSTENTVDTLKSGSAQTEVLGIATTFMPTYNVLLQAANRGINLVIAHESPFYHHRDKVDMLERDRIYQAKKALIEESRISIFRFHDHMHRRCPDQIVSGLLKDLGWSEYVQDSKAGEFLPIKTSPLSIPTTPLGEIAKYVKDKLSISFVRVVGDLSMPCARIGILPGYCGSGELAIPYFQNGNLDLIITGEGPEWETPEYVRDAVALGEHRALLVLGHSSSEESGMKHLADFMRPFFPSVPVEFISEDQPFTVI